MTRGQELALWQLREIAASGEHSLDIESVIKPGENTTSLILQISLRIGPIPFREGGLILRERESFVLSIPATFPLKKPEVAVPHRRFAGYAHVQWTNHLCLYQSSSEWNPSDGIFGLLDRLIWWIKQGALNQLDPDAQPLHPPAVYADAKAGKLIIPRQDTPSFEGSFWIGLAKILELDHRVEITGWHKVGHAPADGVYAMALLFGSSMPWEYPTKGADLFDECSRKGIPKELFFQVLQASSILAPTGSPLYFVLGSPMRGSTFARKQHLSVWAIDAQTAEYIYATVSTPTDTEETLTKRSEFEHLLLRHLSASSVSWCPVMEARPEVTIRRDHDSTLSYFRGKSVALWGCGALGGHIALHLCRAGVSKIILWDKGFVTPGILVRQPYSLQSIGRRKVDAMKASLLDIRTDIEIEIHHSDLENTLSSPSSDWSSGIDAIIDATASDAVRRRLDMVWNAGARPSVSLASLMIDQQAKRLVTAVVDREYTGSTWDVLRKAKIETLRDSSYKEFSDAFFPSEFTKHPFQPEPGCSEPTFVGSSADSAAMASIGLNMIAHQLSRRDRKTATVQFLSQAREARDINSPPLAEFNFPPDFCLKTAAEELRISPGAFQEMRGWIAQNRRLRGRAVETGGLVWGEWDDATGIIWVSGFSGPPKDSRHSSDFFLRGIVGTKDEHEFRMASTRRSVGYIGEWHTHPISSPLPSGTDLLGMHANLTVGELPPHKSVLIIIGKEAGVETIGAYLFRRRVRAGEMAVHELNESRKPLPSPIL